MASSSTTYLKMHKWNGTDGLLRQEMNENFQKLENEFRARSVNVKWYKAKGDGVTDDRAAIQLAIDEAAQNGASGVFFPVGTYNAAGLIPRSNLIYWGVGVDSVLTSNGNALASFVNGNQPIHDIRFENLLFLGGVQDSGTFPRRGRNKSPGIEHGIRLSGSLVPGENNPEIRNVQIRSCSFNGISSLPVLLRGVSGRSRVIENDFYNCLDVGFIWTEKLNFSANHIDYSADNGVSISRSCRRVTCNNNIINYSAYAGIWLAGWEDSVGTSAAGVENFTCTGNVISWSGQFGIKLTDAPKYGTISGNLINTVYRGPVDELQDNAGIGINVGGFPYLTAPSNPTSFAEGLTISDNTIISPARGGIKVMGCKNITIADNQILDAGTQYYSNGTTAIGSSNLDQNFGISLDRQYAATISDVYVRDNTIIDRRSTPITNFPLVCGAESIHVYCDGNRSRNTRNGLTDGLAPDALRRNHLENVVKASGNDQMTSIVTADKEGFRRLGLLKRPALAPVLAVGVDTPFAIAKASTVNVDDPAATYTNILYEDVQGALRTPRAIVAEGGLRCQPGWNEGHLVIGDLHIWTDLSNRPRFKFGAPTGPNDGQMFATTT
ncbi:hypothetical protein HGI30_15190 [Paenibacillus albicereus]|uniref:Rhamnogalacturonase A/B/Epimerase-like pectate lyase domain-containing protein n=1 Tax=Paenibacillus albicereus TaxID=2726185 RepID=A0A6H2GZF5_9BACL|nr:right-handed parallel beta-helix repeat-containing protein [Paenibacillus albicereus]QJC52777.1 hypothetical protein HGI30_15190 [Paenibacillus albicereus]